MLAVFASMVAELDGPDHDVGRVFVLGKALHRDEALVFLEADRGVAQLVAERREADGDGDAEQQRAQGIA